MNDPNINEEVYEGFMNAAWQIIERECMYTELDRFEPTDAHSIAKALREVADVVVQEMFDRGQLWNKPPRRKALNSGGE